MKYGPLLLALALGAAGAYALSKLTTTSSTGGASSSKSVGTVVGGWLDSLVTKYTTGSSGKK